MHFYLFTSQRHEHIPSLRHWPLVCLSGNITLQALLILLNPATGYCTTIGTYKLCPVYCTIPEISVGNHTFLQQQSFWKRRTQLYQLVKIKKNNHYKILHKLANVFSKHQSLRLNRWVPRQIDSVTSPTVGAASTIYVDPTSPESIDSVPRIHRCKKTATNIE